MCYQQIIVTYMAAEIVTDRWISAVKLPDSLCGLSIDHCDLHGC